MSALERGKKLLRLLSEEATDDELVSFFHSAPVADIALIEERESFPDGYRLESILWLAVCLKRVKFVEALLRTGRASVNLGQQIVINSRPPQTISHPPINRALCYHLYEVLQVLLEHGAIVPCSIYGRRTLLVAFQPPECTSVKILSRYAQSFESSWDELVFDAVRESTEFAQWYFRVSIDSKHSEGCCSKALLDIARECGDIEIILQDGKETAVRFLSHILKTASPILEARWSTAALRRMNNRVHFELTHRAWMTVSSLIAIGSNSVCLVNRGLSHDELLSILHFVKMFEMKRETAVIHAACLEQFSSFGSWPLLAHFSLLFDDNEGLCRAAELLLDEEEEWKSAGPDLAAFLSLQMCRPFLIKLRERGLFSPEKLMSLIHLIESNEENRKSEEFKVMKDFLLSHANK